MRDQYYPMEYAPMYQAAPPPAAAEPEVVKHHFTMGAVLERWNAIELDLHDKGIDCESGILEHRTWRWLELLIGDLVANADSRIGKSLRALP